MSIPATINSQGQPRSHGLDGASAPAGPAVPTPSAAGVSRDRKASAGRVRGELRPAEVVPCPVCDPVIPSGEWSLCPMHLVMQLRRLGLRIDVPRAPRFFSLQEVADMLSVSVSWVRQHLDQFPGRIQLSGGDRRIPLTDVEDVIRSHREA